MADDHPVILAGLARLLEPEFEVVGTATDGRALLKSAIRWRPDLVIVDISMPGLDGIEATRRLQTAAPGVRVLILSIHAEPSFVRSAFAAGAYGYLTKTSPPEEIERAVREVLADRFYVCPAVTRAAIGLRMGGEAEFLASGCGCLESAPPTDETLTPRELDTLRLLAKGLDNREIARRLGVAVTTVRSHLRSLYDKLSVASRVELALYAAHSAEAAT